MRLASLLLAPSLLALAACGAGGADSPSGSGGGGVSFGGAQDIGEFRNILDNGGVPGPDTLDANGFFNEHFNDLPPAGCAQTLCLTPGLSVGRDWLNGEHQATLQISVNTNVDPADYHRLPMSLVVVVDHSGSMAEDGRLDKVKVGLHALVDGLLDEDRLALVEFDDQVDVDAPFGETLDRPALHAIIDSLQPRGATDIYDGLQQGFDLLGDAPPSERQNRVIFLSDGNATAGDTSEADIMAMARGYVERGVGLTTIGVGNDFDVTLMRGLAEQGAGNFYFLEDPTAATEVFTQELDYFVQPLALDVDIAATAGGGYDFGEAVGSHLWADDSRSGAMHVPAVFVASRTSQSGSGGRRGGGSMIFIHVVPNGHNVDGKVADLRLSYRAPGSPEIIAQTVTLAYTGDPETTPADPYLSSTDMAERYAMYNMFLGFRAAVRSSTTPSCAAAALVAARAAGAAWNQAHEDPDIEADLALLDEFVANLRAVGASTGQPLASCAIDPYNPPGDQNPDDGFNEGYRDYACSAGHPSGWGLIALAGLAVVARRRKR